MLKKPPLGLFITGTDTGVGKTYVASLIARSLVAAGKKVGVYKPAASGCRREAGAIVADDAVQLCNAAAATCELSAACPQCFEAPLAPHLAARAEGKEVDAELLRRGIEYWHGRCDIVLVEGAGGLMSPVTVDEYVADLAYDFGYPLIVVAANKLGAINQTLQTLISAAAFRDGVEIAGVILNDSGPHSDGDVSVQSNLAELQARCVPPVLAHVRWQDERIRADANWLGLAKRKPHSR